MRRSMSCFSNPLLRNSILLLLVAVLALATRGLAAQVATAISPSSLPGERPPVTWLSTNDNTATNHGVKLTILRALITEKHTTVFYALSSETPHLSPRLEAPKVKLDDERGNSASAVTATELAYADGLSLGVLTFDAHHPGSTNLNVKVSEVAVTDTLTGRVENLPAGMAVRFVRNEMPTVPQRGMNTIHGAGVATSGESTVAYDPEGGFLGGPQQVGTFKFNLSDRDGSRSVYVLCAGDGAVRLVSEDEYRDAINRYR